MINDILIYYFIISIYLKQLTNEEYNKQFILKRQ